MDIINPFREWKPFVSAEGPEFSTRRGQGSNIPREYEDKQDD
ncbi:hypothetical protein M7I_8035 [Glarea lozoyensis 74030]|uniref:Uncharacterized protein n=1 Tax=Glarea lozoyensis (strain ATCC 74030 / MF5533) TaxID=1104152 RepID=H0EYX4_GLAL7|nr:hypothetical protein M7I_8035 [Glarea lozoyensis 74030]